jgi:hypothetical protein
MHRFPEEFEDLLTPFGREVLHGKVPEFKSIFASSKRRFAVLKGLIKIERARSCMRLLDSHIYKFLSVDSNQISADSISRMKVNYSEALEKICHLKTAFLSAKSARSYVAAEKVGLLDMLQSRSFSALAEAVTGLHLAKPPNYQIFCYEHGDYVGPHNDYFPEEDPECQGCVDIHVTLSNRAVAHQYVIYERNRHLSQMVDVNLEGGISFYRLPFWHQVTPLTGKAGREAEARRWLIMGTFDLSHSGCRPLLRRQPQ